MFIYDIYSHHVSSTLTKLTEWRHQWQELPTIQKLSPVDRLETLSTQNIGVGHIFQGLQTLPEKALRKVEDLQELINKYKWEDDE